MPDESWGAHGFTIPLDRMSEARAALDWLKERNPKNFYFPPNHFVVADVETVNALRERFGMPEWD